MTVARLLRSIRHTPVSQLAHRLALILKRRTLVKAARLMPSIGYPQSLAVPALSDDLPVSTIQAPHGYAHGADGDYTFRFLNFERKFSLPLDWHRDDLNTGTRLWKLHLHYLDYTDALSDTAFCDLVKDWIRQNRPYRPTYWMDSWNSYAISIRIVSWIDEYRKRRERLDDDFRTTLRVSIHEQLRYLENNLERDIGGNHLVKNIKALYWGGRFFSGTIADQWTALADRLLLGELNKQILGDGFHFELSPAYHCQVFGDLLDCWQLMREGDLRRCLSSKLTLMAQAVADLSHPDGGVSLFNDGGLSMAASGNDLLDAYEKLLGDRPRPRRSASFPLAGYYVLRGDNFYLAYDAGRVGPDGLPAHAHGDIFAFELTVGGQRMIVDSGVFEYNAGARRSRSRSTLAHNTVTIDNQDQCEFWSAFRLGRRANIREQLVRTDDKKIVVDAEHDGYRHLAGSPIHRREIRASSEGNILVKDVVKGGKGQRTTSRLLLHPSVAVSEIGPGRLLLRSEAACAVLDTGHVRVEIEDASWWPDFGVEIAAKQIVMHYGFAPGEWTYRVQIDKHLGDQPRHQPCTSSS